MTRNVNPGEGGPGGPQLEVKTAAYYLLTMLAEVEPRGSPGTLANKIKFQRGYEGHALDDIVIVGRDAVGDERFLEIQAKRTIDFTPSDVSFGKLIAQLVRANGGESTALAAAIARTSTKIERHYHQLLTLARKMSSGASLRRALEADRVSSQGMRDFAHATAAQMRGAGASDDDDALWRTLRRFQILVFDFESPGAISTSLAGALAQLALPIGERHRAGDLWDALVTKSLSYDADGGELTRTDLVDWLAREKGIPVVASRSSATARERFAEHSRLGLDAIDDSVGGIHLDRTERIETLTAATDRARFIEIVGESGTGKSALLKALAHEQAFEARPLFLSPGRVPSGGWLTLSTDLKFDGSAPLFLGEIAASGCTMIFIDGLDRISDEGAQETIKDLIIAAADVPGIAVVVSVGPDFTADDREWLPANAISSLRRETHSVSQMSEAEVTELASADRRLAQLVRSEEAKPLTRNLFQLRQLLNRAEPDLPASETALACSWWERGTKLARIQQRDRLKALRVLALQAIELASPLDIASLDSSVSQDLINSDVLTETVQGAKGLFRHDVLRDWSIANLLREEPALRDRLDLKKPAPPSAARALELYARMLIEASDGLPGWSELLDWASAQNAHGSWRRVVLLALVRSELGLLLLDRAQPVLEADQGRALCDLIRFTEAVDSRSGVDALVAAGMDPATIPRDFRIPSSLSWARLIWWLLAHIDDLAVPVGRDVLRFFTSWLLASPGGGDDLSPLIAAQLYRWLIHFEADPLTRQADYGPFFTSNGDSGSRQLAPEIRSTFLAVADRAPKEAEAYLRAHIGGNQPYNVVEDILQFPQAAARAAPAAMSAFVMNALIEDEDDESDRRRRRRRRGRFANVPSGFFPPSPTRGPFLSMLRADPDEGLRLIRSLLNHGLGIDDRANDAPYEDVTVRLPSGVRHFPRAGSYFLSRQVAGADVMICALRALEAWGHEQVEGGRSAIEVVDQILEGEYVPAATLAVAMDVLLSHVQGSDAALAPFLSSPELIELDWQRFNRDRTGVDQLGADGEVRPADRPSNADLAVRGSRGTSLLWSTGEFLFSADPVVVEGVRSELRAERSRLEAVAREDIHVHDPRWQADQALRRLDPANWRDATLQLPDGRAVAGREYVPPDDEQATMAPLREDSNASLAELALIFPLVDALLNPEKRDKDLVARGIAWAKTQQLEQSVDGDEDFDRSQRWRAMIAAAALVPEFPDHAPDLPWSRNLLERALEPRETDGISDHIAQLRYHAGGLAALGWISLTLSGGHETIPKLLEVATRGDDAFTAAFMARLTDITAKEPKIPKSLLRVALTAAIFPERDWDDPSVEERGKVERRARLDRIREEELAWLAGGPEPSWPELPASRRYVERGQSVLWDDNEEEGDHDDERAAWWFNHQSAGKWLDGFERSEVVREQSWICQFVAAYSPWTAHAWGGGLGRDDEVRELPTEWLHPFERLRLRMHAGDDGPSFRQACIEPALALPDSSLFDLVEAAVPAADRLFLNEQRLPIDRLVELRSSFIDRFLTARHWHWRRNEVTDMIGTDIAGALRALHFHSPFSFGPAVCLLPAEASGIEPTFASIGRMTLDAPGLSVVSDLFLKLCERSATWIPPNHLLEAAEAWQELRPTDVGFWRDHRFGERICQWVVGGLDRGAFDGETLKRIGALVDKLAAIGITHALALEIRLRSG